MFVQLWRALGGGVANAEYFLQMSPAEIQWLMEFAWSRRFDRAVAWSPLGSHFELPVPPPPPAPIPGPAFQFERDLRAVLHDPGRDFEVQHLMYAYLVENTRVFEIVERLISQLVHGESVGFATPAAQAWLRTTEEVFFSDAPHGLAHRVSSVIRPDARAIRRNAYYRLFGLDLNHGSGMTAGSSYVRSANANTDFVPTFEELLREVWKGIVYVNSIAGPSEIDNAKMAELVRKLREMLTTRRQHGNLRREEFNAVAYMSWFHLTFLVDSAIITSLGVQMQTEVDRLKMVGSRVNFNPHQAADSFFQLADPMSAILIGIEDGNFNGIGGVAQFYTPGVAGAANITRQHMETIITHWSIATGRNLKARDVNQMPVGAMTR